MSCQEHNMLGQCQHSVEELITKSPRKQVFTSLPHALDALSTKGGLPTHEQCKSTTQQKCTNWLPLQNHHNFVLQNACFHVQDSQLSTVSVPVVETNSTITFLHFFFFKYVFLLHYTFDLITAFILSTSLHLQTLHFFIIIYV